MSPAAIRSVVLTGTGFTGDGRAQFHHNAASLGCGYSPELVRGTSTHLVCRVILNAAGSPKYSAALAWNIPIVSYQWLLDSLAAGHLLSESAYQTDQLQATHLLCPSRSAASQKPRARSSTTHSSAQPQLEDVFRRRQPLTERDTNRPPHVALHWSKPSASASGQQPSTRRGPPMERQQLGSPSKYTPARGNDIEAHATSTRATLPASSVVSGPITSSHIIDTSALLRNAELCDSTREAPSRVSPVEVGTSAFSSRDDSRSDPAEPARLHLNCTVPPTATVPPAHSGVAIGMSPLPAGADIASPSFSSIMRSARPQQQHFGQQQGHLDALPIRVALPHGSPLDLCAESDEGGDDDEVLPATPGAFGSEDGGSSEDDTIDRTQRTNVIPETQTPAPESCTSSRATAASHRHMASCRPATIVHDSASAHAPGQHQHNEPAGHVSRRTILYSGFGSSLSEDAGGLTPSKLGPADGRLAAAHVSAAPTSSDHGLCQGGGHQSAAAALAACARAEGHSGRDAASGRRGEAECCKDFEAAALQRQRRQEDLYDSLDGGLWDELHGSATDSEGTTAGDASGDESAAGSACDAPSSPPDERVVTAAPRGGTYRRLRKLEGHGTTGRQAEQTMDGGDDDELFDSDCSDAPSAAAPAVALLAVPAVASAAAAQKVKPEPQSPSASTGVRAGHDVAVTAAVSRSGTSRPGRTLPPAAATLSVKLEAADVVTKASVAEHGGSAVPPAARHRHTSSSHGSVDRSEPDAHGGEDGGDDDFRPSTSGSAVKASGSSKMLSRLLRKVVAAADSVGAGGRADDGDVVVVKALSRPARDTTALQHHGLTSLRGVTFADQALIVSLQLLLLCKDKARRTRCPVVVLPAGGTGGQGTLGACASSLAPSTIVIEPFAMYRMPTGEWWLEGVQFLTRGDALQCGGGVQLPRDFQPEHELLRSTGPRVHCRLRDIHGEVGVVRCKGASKPPTSRSSAVDAFCRFAFDAQRLQVLTDQPVSDFTLSS